MKTLRKISNALRMAACVAAMAACSAPVMAQDSVEVARPVASMFTLDVGHTSLLDTYLTPVTYGGTHLRLGYQTMQATAFNPQQWVRNLELAVEYDNVKNPAGNNTMHSAMIDARWSIMRRWHMGSRLQLMGGAVAALRGGATYNGGNSNNICSVKAHVGIGLAGMAVYPVQVGRLPVTLGYQLTTPVIGAFYSPDYDESYYEIYVGNRSGLVHPAWWGNRLEINNLVSADMHLGSTIVRVGYRNHVEHSWVSNLKTHITSHAIVIGVGGEFLSLGRNHKPRHNISAIY